MRLQYSDIVLMDNIYIVYILIYIMYTFLTFCSLEYIYPLLYSPNRVASCLELAGEFLHADPVVFGE